MRSRISDTAALTAVMVGLLIVVITALLVVTDEPQQPAARTSPSPSVTPTATPTAEASATGQTKPPRPTRSPGDRETCVDGGTRSRLTVLTFNIHSARTPDGSVRLSEIASELATWDADVVLLQEVDRGRAWTGGVDMPAVLADQLGLAWAFGTNVRRSATNLYGTAILSRFPIESYTNTALPAPPGTQQRGLLNAVVDVDGTEMSVYGTHLEHTSADARVQQMRAIAPILAADPRPKVFGGDLNARPGSPVLLAAGSSVRDTWQAIGDGAGLTHPAGVPQHRIDYLMHGDGSAAELAPLAAQVLASNVSDHRAVWATYELTSGSDTAVCVPVVPEQG
ncbi:endonuclease/exonuclease/phosphatase family protein [Nocardioides sp. SR21]|uniref:endonuclease/exonuclease/phosphatase family protein n=1 Tax=Nocardioides sp. SR21 TaxID=2919501 RepID=UPI001FAA5834|nr:endonuclease/exonuclease/phosphatase family protein [Nocardioides sp. SR21]